MTPQRLLHRAVVAAVVATFALTACADAGEGGAPAVAAGNPVTDDELTRATAVFQGLSDAQQVPCGDTADVRASDPPDAACNRFTLGVMIQIRLAEGYAADHDVTVSEADVKDTTTRFSSSMGDGVLDGALQATGATRQDLLTVVRGSLLLDAVARDLAERELGESGLRKAYDEKIASFTIVQVDHILVKTEAEAQDVYEQVTAPGFTEDDFLALAKDVSIDPSAAQNSGSLGSATASTYVTPFADAALSLAPGEISPPVETEFGWHVIWMVDAEVTPFDEARTKILADAQGASFFAYVGERAAAGDIEVDPSFGRFDPQTLTVVAIRSTDPGASASPTPVNASPAAG